MILQRITHASPQRHNAAMHDQPNSSVTRETIKRLRIERGFPSDRALAIAAGLNQPTLSRYLKGESATMELASFQALCRIFNLTLSELMGEVPYASPAAREVIKLMAQLDEPQREQILRVARALTRTEHHH